MSSNDCGSILSNGQSHLSFTSPLLHIATGGHQFAELGVLLKH